MTITPKAEQQRRMRAQFRELAQLEPRLLALEDHVCILRIQARRAARVCANEAWYGRDGRGGVREWIIALVGWDSDSPHRELHTSRAYDIAYRYLYGRLPCCRRCGCSGPDGLSIDEARRMPTDPLAVPVVPAPMERALPTPHEPIRLRAAAEIAEPPRRSPS